MKVVDIQFYRSRKELALLEKKIVDLAQQSDIGAAKKLKSCFKEWLSKTGSQQ